MEQLRVAAASEEVIGLLLVSVDDHVLDFVRGLNIPAVLVNGDDPEMCLSSVTPCNRSAATLASRHLMRLGHERIAFLSRPGRRTITRRLEGWRDALGPMAEGVLELDVEDWTAEAAAAGSIKPWMRASSSQLLSQRRTFSRRGQFRHCNPGACKSLTISPWSASMACRKGNTCRPP